MIESSFVPPTEAELRNDRDPKVRRLTALSLRLTQDLVLPDRDFVAWVDSLIVVGRVRIPGRRVALFARELIFQGDAQIDVSGEDGLSYEGQSAGPGSAAGEAGSSGRSGGQGMPGGSIYLVSASATGSVELLARGGNGGGGENGGQGAAGRNGARGADARPRQQLGLTSGAPGEDGGKGGDGGRAGPSGAGGAGGHIVVAIQNSEGFTCKTNAEGGSGGQPAEHGMAGGGGTGGEGGVNLRESYQDDWT